MATTPIEDVVAAAKANLIAGGDTVPHYYGAEYLQENNSPPRYVWIEATYAPSQEIPKRTNPRAIGAFLASLGVHCWGESRGDAFQLAQNVCFAIKMHCHADARLQSSGWLEERRDGWSKKGHVFLLGVGVLVPMLAEMRPTAEIQGTAHEGVMGFSSGDYTAC